MMLADFADDGSLESSGVFTLNLDKAGEKLAEYRLHNPGLFVLNLVAAAVMGKATRFDVETNENITSFKFEPKVEIVAEQMDRLFAHILEPSAPAHVRELALAVHGARSLPGQPVITLAISNTQLSQDLVLEEQGHELKQMPPRPPGVVLELRYAKLGGWSRLFARKGGRSEAILQHLYHFCRYAPLTLSNNGQAQGTRLTAGIYESAVFAWRSLTGEQTLNVVSAERRHDLFISRKQQSPVASSMVITLVNPTQSREAGVLIISRGVTFHRPPRVLDFPLARAVITADHLEKNLSQSDLVEGEEYEALMQVVREQVDELVLEVCSNPPLKWTAATAQCFLKALAGKYPDNDSAPLQVKTFRRLAQLDKQFQTDKERAEQVAFWRELSQTDPQAGEKFRLRLVEFFENLARRSAANGVWPVAARGLHHLNELGARPPDVLNAVLLALAGGTERAGSLLTPDLPGYTPPLAYLLRQLEVLEENSPTAWLLRLQRAVEDEDLLVADALSEHLKGVEGTALLYLWLGWYAISRKRFSEACELWDKALKLVDIYDRQTWAGLLWRELNGKVSFADQVRWQAKRSVEELQRSVISSLSSQEQSRGVRDIEAIDWAEKVWMALIEGRRDEARTRFMENFLSARINPHALRLEPLHLYGTKLSFFG